MSYRLLITTILIASSCLLTAQSISEIESAKTGLDPLSKADYSFTTGVQVGSFVGNGYWWNNYFSPSANFKLNNKLSITAGIGLGFSQYQGSLYNSEFAEQADEVVNVSSLSAYVMGSYSVNPKLSIMGGVQVEENWYSNPGALPASKNYKDVLMGVNYKINDKVSFNAIMRVSDKPYYNSYYNPAYSRPFPSSGFSPFMY